MASEKRPLRDGEAAQLVAVRLSALGVRVCASGRTGWEAWRAWRRDCPWAAWAIVVWAVLMSGTIAQVVWAVG